MNAFRQGTVHLAAPNLQTASRADVGILDLWNRLTPLGCNEFICWVEDAKQQRMRERRIDLTRKELLEGKERPCCWSGCIHCTGDRSVLNGNMYALVSS